MAHKSELLPIVMICNESLSFSHHEFYTINKYMSSLKQCYFFMITTKDIFFFKLEFKKVTRLNMQTQKHSILGK